MINFSATIQSCNTTHYQFEKMKKDLFISNSGRGPDIYENKFLESLTRSHYSVPIFVFVPVLVFFVYRSLWVCGIVWWQLLLCWAVMLGFLSVFEYTMHRYLFHLKTDNATLKKIIHNVHGKHHDYPNDLTRLVVMPVVSIPAAVLFFGLFYLLFGPVWTNPLYGGLITSYVIYDWMHYAVHKYNFNNSFF